MLPSEVVFYVHSLPRFVSDFGAVARRLNEAEVPIIVSAPAASALPGMGWDRAHVIASCRAALPPEIRHEELPIDRQRIRLRHLVGAARAALRAGRSRADGIFVFWTILPILCCGLPLRFLGRRCVFLLTGLGSVFGSEGSPQRLRRALVLLLYAYLFRSRRSRVIVHNREDKEFLVQQLRVSEGQITVTPGCGVDPVEYPFSEPRDIGGKKIVLVPVRLLKEKGVLEAAAASEILRKRGIEHEMWFSCSVDPGNPSSLSMEDLERLAGTHPSVRFLGYQPEMLPIYQASDIVCVPTWYPEGLPTALLEAASCGRPIVATDNVGCREFVEHEHTGLVVPVRSADALADALERLIGDDDLAETLRRAAYRRFRASFTKDVMVDRTIESMRGLGLLATPPLQPSPVGSP